MFWPYTKFFELIQSAHVKVESELRAQLAIRSSQIANLEQEREQLKMKLERMELVMMPMQSQAGRAYVQSISPARPTPSSAPRAVESMGWNEYLKHHMEEIDLTEAQALALKEQH